MTESAEEFARLRESDDIGEQHRSSNEEIPLSVCLEVIERFPHLRSWIAHNKKVPIEVLELLASDPDPHVRDAVARKRKLTPPLFERLARDSESRVRATIAYNRSCPTPLLQDLAKDNDGDVKRGALNHLSRRHVPPANSKHGALKTRAAKSLVQRWRQESLDHIVRQHHQTNLWALPSDSGAKTALAIRMAALLEGDALVYVEDWGVWPSAQHPPLFHSLRKAQYGTPKPLYEFPADYVAFTDRDYTASLLALGMYFFWSVLLVSREPSFSFFVSHDEFMSWRSDDRKLSEMLEEIMSTYAAPGEEEEPPRDYGHPG
jgi:hypothetical protein